MMAQAQEAMQMVEQQMQVVQQEAQQADVDKSEVKVLIANLKTEQANFQAKVAQEMAKIAEKKAQLTVDQLSGDSANFQANSEMAVQASREQVAAEAQQFNSAMAGELAQGVEAIQQLAAEFNKHAVETLAHIQSEKDDKPKIVKIKSQRVNGKLEAVPVYESTGNESEMDFSEHTSGVKPLDFNES